MKEYIILNSAEYLIQIEELHIKSGLTDSVRIRINGLYYVSGLHDYISNVISLEKTFYYFYEIRAKQINDNNIHIEIQVDYFYGIKLSFI